MDIFALSSRLCFLLVDSMLDELLLYLQAVKKENGRKRGDIIVETGE